MSRIVELLRHLREDIRLFKRAYHYLHHGDPSLGIEYNKINIARNVSKRLYSVDTARTPVALKYSHGRYRAMNVQRYANKANRMNFMAFNKNVKCKGET